MLDCCFLKYLPTDVIGTPSCVSDVYSICQESHRKQEHPFPPKSALAWLAGHRASCDVFTLNVQGRSVSKGTSHSTV